MDIKLEKKPWYIRYRYYLAGGVAFLAFLIYVVTLSLGPSKLRIEQDNIQIAEVKNGKFMEYVDVEGVIQPILTIKVNAREAGSVERIIGEEGSLLRQGDTILRNDLKLQLSKPEQKQGKLPSRPEITVKPAAPKTHHMLLQKACEALHRIRKNLLRNFFFYI